MIDKTPVHRLWLDLQTDFSRPDVIWQIAVITLALAVAWWLSGWLEQRVRDRAEVATQTLDNLAASHALNLGAAAFSRVLFPLVVLLIVWLGKAVLGWFYPVSLLRLAVTLAISFAIVRLVVYLLRKVFRTSALLVAFERVVATLIWIGVVLHLTGLLPELVAALESIVLPIGKHKVSAYDILVGALSVTVTLLIALWAGAALERRLMRSSGIDSSLRVVFARAGRALLIVLAVLIALPLVGIDLTLLSVFGGALGVGLGLGLQRIASNYVSGFIILLEKSLRIGDMVTADKYYGAVSQIKTRYTVLRALDGTEAIVPNELLVAQPVLNHSYSNRQVRLVTRVTVAYRHDPEQAMALLVQAASDNPRVLTDPAPAAILVEFGADGFLLELGFWIQDPEEGRLNVTSAINIAIWRLFVANGIEIPYPHRDIRTRTA
ncbi:MAG: mechanosensitive ion channel family protein [Burkholderiales bacterium]|jgi:small-conductance mechanosensitive channel